MARQLFEKIIKSENKARYIWLVFCIVVLLMGIIGGISSGRQNSRIEQVKAVQKTESDEFKTAAKKGEEKTSLRQNKDLEAIALLNVGQKEKNGIKSDDIRNVILLVFAKNNKKQIIDVIALQKDACVGKGKNDSLITIKQSFDRNNPKKLYDAIEKSVDYKVKSYIAYNNDTIKEIMDYLYIVNINIENIPSLKVDDKKYINSEQNRIIDKYPNADMKKVSFYGRQPLNALQAVAYSNLYYEQWGCVHNDWRQLYLLRQMIEGVKGANFNELQQIRNVLLDGDNDISDEIVINAGAAIKNHKMIFWARWSDKQRYITHNSKRYSIPDDNLSVLKDLHKKYFKESSYTPSEKAREYIAELDDINKYIAAFAKKQAEKKAAAERAKEEKRKAAEEKEENSKKANEDGSDNNDDKKTTADNNKKEKKSGSSKKKTSQKKTSSNSNNSKKNNNSNSNNNNKKDNEKKEDSGGNDDPGEPVIPEPDNPEDIDDSSTDE